MRRLLPPTHLLSAFVATAHHGTMARAAADLHLTPGAVSKRVAELEEWVAIPLFERVRKKLVLTPAGTSYLESIAPLLTQLEAATLSLMRTNAASGVLHMALLPTMAEKWLIPHLPEFNAAHPEVDLRFSNYFQIDEDVSKTTLDCLLRFGTGRWDDTESDYLCGREIIVIAPPRALRTHPLETMDDLRRQALIHHVDRPNGWAVWAEVHGIRDMDVQSGPHLSLASTIIGAVSSGVGVALMPQALVLQEIADGTVTMPFPPMLYGEGYYLCHRPGVKDNPAFQTFRRWLLDLARRTLDVAHS
jgi:LysR family transcriptional regulator, glycine cleavage system transcriptional activator